LLGYPDPSLVNGKRGRFVAGTCGKPPVIRLASEAVKNVLFPASKLGAEIGRKSAAGCPDTH
jgi:hypothetical protein